MRAVMICQLLKEKVYGLIVCCGPSRCLLYGVRRQPILGSILYNGKFNVVSVLGVVSHTHCL